MPTHLQKIDPTASIAATVRIRISDGASLVVGPNVTIADGVEIEIAEGGVIHIAEHVSIGPNAVLRGHGDIRIDARATIDAGAVLDTREPVVTAFERSHGRAYLKRPIRICAGAHVGANAVVRAGVTIGRHADVLPCTFVETDVPESSTRARDCCSISSAIEHPPAIRRFLFGFCRWHETARHFVTLANTLRAAHIDSRLYGTPLTLSRLADLDANHAIVREDLSDLDDVLDTWRPDAIFLWSGATQIDQVIIAAARERNITCRFGELGWFPQSKTIHFDMKGTNARSSIRDLDLDRVVIDPRFDDWRIARCHSLAEPPPDIRNYIFVPLQDIRDANITLGSPYQSMDDFVTALATHFPNETFVVRPHPNFSDVPLTPHNNVHVRRDRSIHPWLQHADAVVGINSTALLEALVYGKPTHAVGTGLATGLDVLFEYDDAASLQIHRRIPDDRKDRIRRLLSELVFVRQAWMKDLHYLDRLTQVHGLGDLLVDAPAHQGAITAQPSAHPARS